MDTIMKILKSIFAFLIAISIVHPVMADTEDVKIIRVNKYELGNADVHSRMGIPDRKGQPGTFAIEYEIAYRISTTEAVRPADANPDYIYAEWDFGDSIQVSQANNIPKPVSGDDWCNLRDIKIVCAFPVTSTVGTYYQIQVTYTPTKDCVCMMQFNTDYSARNPHNEIEMIVIPAFTQTVYLPVLSM